MSGPAPLPEPSTAVKLYGTEETVAAPRLLAAGDLSVELDAGNLRHIRFRGVEIMRAISFIVRDRNWGTYNPDIRDLVVAEDPSGFRVTYEALAKDEVQAFSYRARIEGWSDGRVVFEAQGTAETDVLTNRTGFVVLHAIAGVSGAPVRIEHVDGRLVEGRFPDLIDPVQPLKDLRALTHEAAPGLTVTCRMEGDTFEMEDQRNWADASYKTYVRPLALPWPYRLTRGEVLEQAVRLDVSVTDAAARTSTPSVRLGLGQRDGLAPRLGLGLEPQDIAATREHADTLRDLGAGFLICHYDPRRGHDASTLRSLAETAALLGLEPWLEAVVASVDGYAEEVAALGRIVGGIRPAFPVVLLSPAADLKCTLPGSPWPPAPPAEALFRVAREAFPQARIGGGMFSLFTEMNRKRPPVDLLDVVSFTTTATMHAGDDHSVMEGLEALPSIARSARAISGGLPYGVGPSAIGMRMNPYGEAPMANPRNIRQAMNFNDPRQRGLLGAAWAVGFFARMAYGGAATVALGSTTGAFGLLHTPADWPQPWFDVHGGIFPMFHALRGMAGLAGRPLLRIDNAAPEEIAAVAVEVTEGVELWVANLTRFDRMLTLPREAEPIRLDAERFVESTRTPRWLDQVSGEAETRWIALGPYEVARLRLIEMPGK